MRRTKISERYCELTNKWKISLQNKYPRTLPKYLPKQFLQCQLKFASRARTSRTARRECKPLVLTTQMLQEFYFKNDQCRQPGEDPRSGGYSLGRKDVRTLSFLVFVLALRILLWRQQVTLPHIHWKDPNPNLNPENFNWLWN